MKLYCVRCFLFYRELLFMKFSLPPEIRLAKSKDVQAIRQLVNSAYSELAEMGLNFTGTYQDEQITIDRMRNAEVYLLHRGGELVASMNLSIKERDDHHDRCVYIHQLAVRPDCKRQGIGSILIKLAENRALCAGIEKLCLDTAVPAKHLVSMYLHRGFVPIKEVQWDGKTYRSYIMEKRIELTSPDQQKKLWSILEHNPVVLAAIDSAKSIALPNWYIGAGCIVQTVWNYQSGLPINQGIKDIDLIYFDPSDLSEEAERLVEEKINFLLPNFPLNIDVNNQARVHLWYERYFGYPIEAYKSAEGAIDSWPTTATATAVRRNDSNRVVYAPFGLDDLFSMTVRANKRQITKEIYEAKVNRWLRHWPCLKIVPWDEQGKGEL
jgi:uncharacterized protein